MQLIQELLRFSSLAFYVVQDVQGLSSIWKQKIAGPKLFFNNSYRPKVDQTWDDMHHPCLACTWRHHFLKFKIKEPLMFLSSSDMRGGKFISVYPVFSWVACFLWKQAQFIFQSYDGAQHKAAYAFVKKKNTFLLRKVLRKVRMQMPVSSVQTISRLGSQK